MIELCQKDLEHSYVLLVRRRFGVVFFEFVFARVRFAAGFEALRLRFFVVDRPRGAGVALSIVSNVTIRELCLRIRLRQAQS